MTPRLTMASMIPLWFLLLLLRAPISQAAPRTFNLTLESGIRAPGEETRVYLAR